MGPRDRPEGAALLRGLLPLLGLGLLDVGRWWSVQQRPQHVVGLGGLCVHGDFL